MIVLLGVRRFTALVLCDSSAGDVDLIPVQYVYLKPFEITARPLLFVPPEIRRLKNGGPIVNFIMACILCRASYSFRCCLLPFDSEFIFIYLLTLRTCLLALRR